MTIQRALDRAAYIAFIALILLAPLVLQEFWLNRIAKFLVYGILGVAVSLCWGYGGILNLGQGLFFGAGAYMLAMSLKLSSATSLQQGSDQPVPDFMLWNAEPGLAHRALLHQQGLVPLAAVSVAMVRRRDGYPDTGGSRRRARLRSCSANASPAYSCPSSPSPSSCWCGW